MIPVLPRQPAIPLSGDQKRVLWRLRIDGPAPRTALAARLGLHNGAMTRLGRELIALGLVQEQPGGDGETVRGRPVVPLALSGRGCYAAGATVHPGWLELTLADFTGSVIARDIAPFDHDDPRVFAEEIESRLRALTMRTGLLGSRFLGLGIAATGPMRADWPDRRWTVEWTKGWRDVDLEVCIGDVTGLPVWVDNDATVAALAEYYDLGLVRRSRSALVFFIGHGVGGGVIAARGALRGEHGNAGEIGRLFPPGPRPSGIDLLACLREAGADIHSLLDIGGCLESHAGLIDDWVARAGDQLATAVDSGVAWFDPGDVVISGALPPPVLCGLMKRVGQGAWAHGFPHLPAPRLHVTRLGSWAVALGAALLPIHALVAEEGEARFISQEENKLVTPTT